MCESATPEECNIRKGIRKLNTKQLNNSKNSEKIVFFAFIVQSIVVSFKKNKR